MKSVAAAVRSCALPVILLTACSPAPVGDRPAPQSSAPTASPGCALDPGVPAADAKAAESLRMTVEAGPLYGAAAGTGGLASCRIASDSGAIVLDYSFRNGGSMRVRRDTRIEYMNQEVRFASPPADDPVATLTRAEKAAFADGCGIDWKQAETAPASDDPKVSETIYRGDVCNCQARVRRDASSRVVGFVFRSAC